MTELKEQELLEVTGGAKAGALAIISAIGVFLVGVIDGLLRPLKCRK